jgi:glycosyltransferase involved in cell wall biosynthesis
MKIVILTSWFSENMGYIENCLSKSMAKSNHEIHVVSTTAQVYYDHPDYETIYKSFLGNNIQKECVRKIDGYTLHRIPLFTISKKICFKHLGKKLKEINPDVVQVFDAFSFPTLQAAWYKIFLGYKLFTANHTVASVFPLYQKGQSTLPYRIIFWLTRTIPGKLISTITSRCYPPTIDALEIAVKYYGVSRSKTELAPLGVDTDLFCPIPENENTKAIRTNLKSKLGLSRTTIVCIYTGRFTEGKNPLLLAKAIDRLSAMGEPFEALFMGNGEQAAEIKKQKGCYVHEFIPYHELPRYYSIADIGVWPKQESTSMIDAAACGLPIIISNKVMAKERVEGNGLTYIENNVEDLVKIILQMKDSGLRKKLSEKGISKTRENFSWDKIAAQRIKSYLHYVKI